jgi:hypothetical protein
VASITLGSAFSLAHMTESQRQRRIFVMRCQPLRCWLPSFSLSAPVHSGCVARRPRGLDRLNVQAVSVGQFGGLTTAQLRW